MIASAGISSAPKRVLLIVTVDMITPGDRIGSGLLEEVHERALDDRGPRPQRRLVGRALRVEVHHGLREVGVLGVRELLGRRRLQVLQAAHGRSEAPSPARRCAEMSRRTSRSLSSLGLPAAGWPLPSRSWPTVLIESVTPGPISRSTPAVPPEPAVSP